MKRLILLLVGIGAHTLAVAQNVGIGSTSFTPNSDALLELRSTTSGVLLPKMTQAQRDAIASPTESLIIYQTTNPKGFKYYDGTAWIALEADDLGSHIAEQNIELTDYWLSNDGDNEGIRVSNDGNVGIGTATPDRLLNVGAATGASVMLTREDNTTASGDVLGELIFDSTDDTSPSTTDGSVVIRATASENHGNSNKGGTIRFLTKPSGTPFTGSAVERLTIQSDGNIGVGKSAPAAQLHTTGTVRMDNLAGTGTRMVVANATGDLSTQAIPSGGGGGGSGNFGLSGSMLTLHLTANVTSLDVAGVSYIQGSSAGDNEIRGLRNGVVGQIILVWNTDPSGGKIKFKKSVGNQKFLKDNDVNTTEGAIMVYDGNNWFFVSHH